MPNALHKWNSTHCTLSTVPSPDRPNSRLQIYGKGRASGSSEVKVGESGACCIRTSACTTCQLALDYVSTSTCPVCQLALEYVST